MTHYCTLFLPLAPSPTSLLFSPVFERCSSKDGTFRTVKFVHGINAGAKREGPVLFLERVLTWVWRLTPYYLPSSLCRGKGKLTHALFISVLFARLGLLALMTFFLLTHRKGLFSNICPNFVLPGSRFQFRIAWILNPHELLNMVFSARTSTIHIPHRGPSCRSSVPAED